MEKAELLCDLEENDGNRRSLVVLVLLVGVVAPFVAVVPFLFALEGEGQYLSRDKLIVSSVYTSFVVA